MDKASPAPERPRSRLLRRLRGTAIGLLASGAVVAFNVPTVGAVAENWYHEHQMSRPSHQARYGLLAKFDIPAEFRVKDLHSALLYNGDVLIAAGQGSQQAVFKSGTFKSLLLNTVTMRAQLIPTPRDLVWTGHIELPDGNVLIAGGTARYNNYYPVYAGGSMTVMNYDTSQSLSLPQGAIFTAPGGAQFKSAFALTIPRARQQQRTASGAGGAVIPGKRNVWVDAVREGTRSVVPTSVRYEIEGLNGPYANELFYGVGTPMTLPNQNFRGTEDAYVFDVKTARFVKVNSWEYAGWYPILAELGSGMSRSSGSDSGGLPLPSGSVLTLGGNPLNGSAHDAQPKTFNPEIDVYYPPSLFQGPRPAIEAAPTVLKLSHSYQIRVSQAADIKHLRLVRPDNLTPVTDAGERPIAVNFAEAGNGYLKVTLPASPNRVPPGFYMLFAVNNKGIPSTARWVQVVDK